MNHFSNLSLFFDSLMADSDEDSDATYFFNNSDDNSDTDSNNLSEESIDSFLESDSTDFSEEVESVEEEAHGTSEDVELEIIEGQDASDEFEPDTQNVELAIIEEQYGSDEFEPDTQNTASNDGTDSESEQTVEAHETDDDRLGSPEVVSDEEPASRVEYMNVPAEVAQENVPQERVAERNRNTQRNENNSSLQPAGNNSNNESDEVLVLEDNVKLRSPSSLCKTQGEKRPLDDSFVDDGMTCSICLDSFTNSGPHRLSSLRCGHLFGQSCVERWLRVGCKAGARRCPTCNKKAAVKDIRILYARKLVAIDTSELDKFKEELNKALLNKNVLDLEIQVCKLDQDMLKRELEILKKELEIARSKAVALPVEINQSQTTSRTSGFELKLVKVIDVCSIGGCRVMAYDRHMNLVVSTQSKNNLFPGYGLKKFDVLEFRPGQLIPLHPKMIRDVAFHRIDKDILLSVSLDSAAKLLDLRCNSGLNTYSGGSPLWACCWDANNSNLFYAGAQSGTVSQFDTRNIYQAVNTWVAVGDRTPIVSLAGVPGACHSYSRQAGFLSCRLNSMWAYEQEDAEKWMEPRTLSIAGPFMSMSYNEDTQLILTSSRPSNRFPYTRHILNQISGNFRSCNLIHSIKGSSTASVMSRSCFVNPPSTNTSYVAAFNESASRLEMFDTASGQMACKYSVDENIVDLCPVYVNGSCALTAVTDKKLMVYKFNSV